MMPVWGKGRKLIRSVYRAPRFDKKLETIRKAGKKGSVAAIEAGEIINRLIQGCNSPAEIGVITKNGERRIKKCTKYDLGCGYRLITVLDGECLFITYIGTHDECNLWLEKNKYLQPSTEKPRGKLFMVQKPPADRPSIKPQKAKTEDELSLRPIEEKYLRKIFNGLCNRGVD
ncbi:MAG: hypothetical protein KKE00_00410 [Proteobacteria bacterium]|nr:hypothetical protein [Pseudomonadota bacterium]MBU1568984.1 hypothetical protein [Pseudomonadota bacterium]